MIEYRVDISELKRLEATIPQLGDIIVDEMGKAMDESGLLLTTIVSSRISAHSKDTGLLASAVEWPSGFTSIDKGLEIAGTVKASDKVGITGMAASMYANYVEFGTRPHWPPKEPLRLWALRKFGDETIGDMVAAAIAARGTYAKGNFFLAWHYDGGKQKVAQIWNKVPVRVKRRWDRL